MNTLGKIGMVFLIVLNTLFIILGLAFLVGSIVFLVKARVDNVQPLTDSIMVGGFTLWSIVRFIGAVGIIVGVSSLVLAIMGIIGASKKVTGLLIAYAVIVGIVICLEIAVLGGAFTMKSEMASNVKRTMLELLQRYEGNRGDALTTAWNWLFMSLDCCGVNRQSQINDFLFSRWWLSILRGPNRIPGFCCVGAEPSTAALNSNVPCTVLPTPYNSYINRGCYDVLNELFNSYAVTFGVIIVIILLIEIAAIVFAGIIIRQLKTGSDKRTVN